MRILFKHLVVLLSVATSSVKAEPLLMDQFAYQQCESEAFLSLIIARNGMHLNNTRQSLLDVKSNEAFAVETINELFDDIDKTGSKDHGRFAAKKFYQCTNREKLSVTVNLDGAAVCLARHDIVFFVNIDRLGNKPQPEAHAKIKRYLAKSSKAVYPDALIDSLTPMVYRISSDDDEYELRRLVFRTCLLPDEWSSWYKGRVGDPTSARSSSLPKNELTTIVPHDAGQAELRGEKPAIAPRDAASPAVPKNTHLPPDRSGIYVYRNEWMGAGAKMEVQVDGTPLGQTSAMTYLYKEVAPGKHVIVSKAENTDSIDIETQPGKVTYVWQEVKMGLGSARSKLSVVDNATGKKGVAETKPVFADALPINKASTPSEQSVTRSKEAKPAVLGAFKPSKPLPLTLDMVRNHIWRYPHPTDLEKHGTIELVFSEIGVQATSKSGGSMGTFELRGDALCLSLITWNSYCVYVTEEEGQKMVFFSYRGSKARLTID